MTSHVLTDAAAAVDLLTRLYLEPAAPSLSDDEATELSRLTGCMVRLAGAHNAVAAGEIARRSTDGSGLAQRSGFRTPIEMVRLITGSTGRAAATAVRVGTLPSWLDPVSAQLGTISVDGADAITRGLGTPTESVPAELLTAEAAALATLDLDADRLLLEARARRDALDEEGIADRELERHAKRSFRFIRLPDSMSRVIWDLDPESAAVVSELHDRATSPKRGGPRFVDAAGAAQAAAIEADERTTVQLASDTMLELLRQGASADSSQLLGSGAPVVRIVVADGATHGFIEGQSDPISAPTVDRLKCAGRISHITMKLNGQVLDVGREQRLFTARQRIALAIRDGGCMWPGCERPPSWTEAHHIEHWARDGGGTDIANGILLCRHHHLLLHNHHWEIERSGSKYWLIPPAAVDPSRTPRLMTTQSRVMREVKSA